MTNQKNNLLLQSLHAETPANAGMKKIACKDSNRKMKE